MSSMQDFKTYLNGLNEIITKYEAVRVGIQVFELSRAEAEAICQELGL